MIKHTAAIVLPDIVATEVLQVTIGPDQAIVRAQMRTEDNRIYPQEGAVFQLRFIPDKGPGSVAEKLVVNETPSGFTDAVKIATDVQKLAYEGICTAYRSGKDEADSRRAVEKWLVKNGRVPTGKVT